MKNEDSVLSMYLKEINKIPLLSHEEEIELALKAQAGDKYAKDKIVNSNLRFVVKVAKKYQNHGLELTDLISEGNIGLLNAIEKFDVSKGYHFISYAVWWINQSILKAISEKSRAIRLPLNRANELVRIEHAKKAVAGNKTEQQEYEEIAEMLNMNVSHVRDMLNISRRRFEGFGIKKFSINNEKVRHFSRALSSTIRSVGWERVSQCTTTPSRRASGSSGSALRFRTTCAAGGGWGRNRASQTKAHSITDSSATRWSGRSAIRS